MDGVDMSRNFTHEIGAAVQKSLLILASPNGLMILIPSANQRRVDQPVNQ